MCKCSCICLKQAFLFLSLNQLQDLPGFVFCEPVGWNLPMLDSVIPASSLLFLSSLELRIDPYISFYPGATQHLAASYTAWNQSLIPVTQKSGVSLALGNLLLQKCSLLGLDHAHLPAHTPGKKGSSEISALNTQSTTMRFETIALNGALLGILVNWIVTSCFHCRDSFLFSLNLWGFSVNVLWKSRNNC